MTSDDLAARGVRVKALEWREEDDGLVWCADIYSISHDGWGYSVFVFGRGEIGSGDTLEAAKAAAQADYEARVTEPLEATPAALAASPEVQALIREAEARGMERAAVIADRHLSKVEINEPLWHEGQDWAAESIALAIRAEAAALRKGETT